MNTYYVVVMNQANFEYGTCKADVVGVYDNEADAIKLMNTTFNNALYDATETFRYKFSVEREHGYCAIISEGEQLFVSVQQSC